MNEPNERLAERIVGEVMKRSSSRYDDWTSKDIAENVQYKIGEWLRSHNIDPATLKPANQTDAQMAEKIADELARFANANPGWRREELRREFVERIFWWVRRQGSDSPTPQPVERDRELARAIASWYVVVTGSIHHKHETNRVLAAITKHLTPERAENEKVREELERVKQSLAASEGKFDAIDYKAHARELQSRLAAAEARVREAQQVARDMWSIASRYRKHLIDVRDFTVKNVVDEIQWPRFTEA